MAAQPPDPNRRPRGAFLAPGRGDGTRGFTLIELLVVLALVGVISTMAATDLSSLIGRYRLNSAAIDLAGAVEACRMTAISENRDCAVRLVTADPSLTGDWRANRGRWETHLANLQGGAVIWSLAPDGAQDLADGPGAQEGVSVEPWVPLLGPTNTQMPDSIVFTPRGFASNRPADFAAGGVIRVVLRNKRASVVERRVVRIDRGGNVQIAVP